MSYLTQLTLQNFRCYDHARLDDIRAGLVVLCGANGAGKTNILEAISLLTPGRGLRGVSALAMQRYDSPQAWGVSAKVEMGGSDVTLGTGINPETERRAVRINGVTAKNQMSLSDYLACLWLTPQMDRLFLDGAAGRRRFLDRLIFTFDSGHSGRVTRYENAMRQRSKLLQDGILEQSWLQSLESQMAETGVAIAAARLDFTNRLQLSCNKADKAEQTYFPRAHLKVTGTIEELLEKSPAVEVEKLFVYQLEQSRARDALVGGAATGPHKSDLAVIYATKNVEAEHCSTGEQKALLIGIILAHSRLMAAERGAPPILLLDEIAAHLDEDRRQALFDRLLNLGGQVWMTGTDPVLFNFIANKAQFFAIEKAQIIPQKTAQAA
ncbi:MAG: DNA replication/repair protein RecF [Alphaproteobacteria bacterium]|nr:DNA replication/repair protein RecF [Alphaproteobacteria bacterium]